MWKTLVLKTLSPYPPPLDRSDNITSPTKKIWVPGTSQLYFLANRDLSHIPKRDIKANTVKRHIVEIYLDILSFVARGYQHFPTLLLPLGQSSVEVTAGNFGTAMTAEGSPPDPRWNRHHALSLTGVAFEVNPTVHYPKDSCFSHDIHPGSF